VGEKVKNKGKEAKYGRLGEGVEDWVYIWKACVKVVFIEVEKAKHVHWFQTLIKKVEKEN